MLAESIDLENDLARQTKRLVLFFNLFMFMKSHVGLPNEKDSLDAAKEAYLSQPKIFKEISKGDFTLNETV